jgi:long-chain acyl-CoA synthetase
LVLPDFTEQKVKMGLYDYTIYSIIKRNARVHGNKIALIFREEKVTHRQYLLTVDRLAAGLSSAGIQKGDRIAVLAHNCLEYIYLYGAAAKIGSIVVPANWRLQPEELEFVISDVLPKVLFVGKEFQPLAESLTQKLKTVNQIYIIGLSDGRFKPFSELLKTDGSYQEPSVHSDDAFVILHTAAVGGRPRGAVLTHGGLTTFNLQAMTILNITESDCHLCMVPLFHLTGLGVSLNILQAGGTNIILPSFDPELALNHIENDRVSIFFEFPPMLQMLLDKNKELKKNLTSLRVIGGLDQPELIKEIEKISGATFWTAFGQSETSGLVTYCPFFERPGSAGKPVYMAEVEIMDRYGNILQPKKSGEIVVRGPMVFRGYWNLDKETEYTFRHGWHHTGDKGHFDEDGYLYYESRMPEKELIKPGGENVYPAEVEKVILEHPLIEEVSVIGVPDPRWSEAIKAVCVLKTGQALPETELIEFVASKIARFKKPKYVVYVSDLPKLKYGTIDRETVKTRYG